MNQKNVKLSLITLVVFVFSTNIYTMENGERQLLLKRSKSSSDLTINMKRDTDTNLFNTNESSKYNENTILDSRNDFAVLLDKLKNEGITNLANKDFTVKITHKKSKVRSFCKLVTPPLLFLNLIAFCAVWSVPLMTVNLAEDACPILDDIVKAGNVLAPLLKAVALYGPMLQGVLNTCPGGEEFIKAEVAPQAAAFMLKFFDICNCTFPST